MAVGKLLGILGLGLVVSLVVTCFFAFNEDKKTNGPKVQKLSDSVSPNGVWIATLETLDNGLGFGQGMLYDEVHIRHPQDAISGHGDHVESSVFYIEAAGSEGQRPQLDWRDSEHLIISYDIRRSDGNPPGKHVAHFQEISIEYCSVPRGSTSSSARATTI